VSLAVDRKSKDVNTGILHSVQDDGFKKGRRLQKGMTASKGTTASKGMAASKRDGGFKKGWRLQKGKELDTSILCSLELDSL
jgi:hypothetical protein